MNLLFVAHYPASNAGTRCRLQQWVTPLEERGTAVSVVMAAIVSIGGGFPSAHRCARTYTLT